MPLYTLGVDVGSLSAKAVIIDETFAIKGYVVLPTGANVKRVAQEALAVVTAKAGVSQEALAGTVSTGYGRARVEFSGRQVTEITCHAKGISRLIPGIEMLIDIGGQDGKVTRIGENGKVVNFVMNDKCAAGTGRFLEVMAKALEIDLDEFADYYARSKTTVKVSSMCTVFAESEAVSLIASGNEIPDIIKGICYSVADRVKNLVERVGSSPHAAMSGGVAKNPGVVSALEERLGVKLAIPEEPLIVGAYGAAVLGMEDALKKQTAGN